MFFRPKAQRLIEELEGITTGKFGNPADYLERYGKANAQAAAYAAKHPEEFIPFLNDDRTEMIGGWMAGSGSKGIALLRQIICDRASPKRSVALRALWEFEDGAADEVGWLTELLSDGDPKIRASAAHCLGRIGERAVSAGAELVRLAQEGNDDEKGSAFFALERTGYDTAIVEQVCYDAIRSGSEVARGSALSTLKEIEGDPNPIVECVLQNIEESDGKGIESAAIDLIAKSDLAGETLRRRAIRALEGLVVKDPPNGVKLLSLLWRLDPRNEVVFGQVERDLKSDEAEMESACDVVCAMKRDGARFVPLLIAQVEKHWDYWDFCWAAVDALGQIGPAAAEARPILERLRAHESDLVKERARRALEAIG